MPSMPFSTTTLRYLLNSFNRSDWCFASKAQIYEWNSETNKHFSSQGQCYFYVQQQWCMFNAHFPTKTQTYIIGSGFNIVYCFCESASTFLRHIFIFFIKGKTLECTVTAQSEWHQSCHFCIALAPYVCTLMNFAN
jgi:hypothetical protein